MGNVIAQTVNVQQKPPKPMKQNISISDLTSKYKQKIDNYNLMINTMTEEQKKIFQIAINLYDIQLRQDRWDSYVGYALKALLMNGWYYNALTGQWMVCDTKQSFVNPDPKMTDEEAYRRYVESLYPRQACSMIGISRWDILDSEVNPNLLSLAMGGEMSFEEYDLTFNLESYEMGGEQSKKKSTAQPMIKHPDIPISPNINVEELTKGDNSTDKFIYAYTDSGLSKNKRDWRPMIMDRIAQQVMEQNPPGNMGHVNPKNVGYELPLPVVTWIGAVTELLPNGVKRLWLKGYIIPTGEGANLKIYIRAKAINSISVYGGLTLLPNPDTGVQEVLDIDLKSIDISGKLKEGLNSGITELAGEMDAHGNQSLTGQQNNKESEGNEMALQNMTLADLKITNPQLYGEMRTEIINSMKTEEQQKAIAIKAGEMDTLTSQMGGNPTEMFKRYQSFAGEMAEAVGMAPTQGMAMPSMSDILAKAKEMGNTLKSVVAALKPAENQTVEAKAEELVQQNQLAMNTKAVQDANAKFADLTKGISNEAIKNLVAMNFSGILQAKPESLPADYAQTSIATLEAQVPTVIQTVTQQAQSLLQTGQQAGEMAIFDNLGVGAGATTPGQKPVDQMTDAEYAKSLGYSFE